MALLDSLEFPSIPKNPVVRARSRKTDQGFGRAFSRNGPNNRGKSARRMEATETSARHTGASFLRAHSRDFFSASPRNSRVILKRSNAACQQQQSVSEPVYRTTKSVSEPHFFVSIQSSARLRKQRNHKKKIERTCTVGDCGAEEGSSQIYPPALPDLRADLSPYLSSANRPCFRRKQGSRRKQGKNEWRRTDARRWTRRSLPLFRSSESLRLSPGFS